MTTAATSKKHNRVTIELTTEELKELLHGRICIYSHHFLVSFFCQRFFGITLLALRWHTFCLCCHWPCARG